MTSDEKQLPPRLRSGGQGMSSGSAVWQVMPLQTPVCEHRGVSTASIRDTGETPVLPSEKESLGPESARPRLRFDRNEWSGAFGDIGTDFPLIAGMILAAGLDPTGVLIAFGLMQIATGLIYRMPM